MRVYSTKSNMKFLKKLSFILALTLALNSCSEAKYEFKITSTKNVKLGDDLTISLEQLDDHKIDSVKLYLNGKMISNTNNSYSINSTKLGVGKHEVVALVFVPQKVKKILGNVEVFANKKPNVYSYKIVNTFPHDKKAYTQGLEFYNGFLYETTGRNGESWLRKVILETGEVLQQQNLDDRYFGEGMTIVNNTIYWLTWQHRKGFIYDLETFAPKGEFAYDKSGEGWGLTHNDSEIIKSDGSNKIWFLNKENLSEKRYIQAYTDKTSLKKLNELEYINGKIYANYWQKPLIAIINPENGIVEGIINLTDLVKEMAKSQKLNGDDVLNGIAYDTAKNRLFVTGKHWNKLFEIELIKQ